VGVISACNYSGSHRKGTPLRKLSGAKVDFLVIGTKLSVKKVFQVFFLKKKSFRKFCHFNPFCFRKTDIKNDFMTFNINTIAFGI
jgi:hypothetical protein